MAVRTQKLRWLSEKVMCIKNVSPPPSLLFLDSPNCSFNHNLCCHTTGLLNITDNYTLGHPGRHPGRQPQCLFWILEKAKPRSASVNSGLALWVNISRSWLRLRHCRFPRQIKSPSNLHVAYVSLFITAIILHSILNIWFQRKNILLVCLAETSTQGRLCAVDKGTSMRVLYTEIIYDIN